jgi:hypothetical protein
MSPTAHQRGHDLVERHYHIGYGSIAPLINPTVTVDASHLSISIQKSPDPTKHRLNLAMRPGGVGAFQLDFLHDI